ncbi:MAG: hypothetical protein NTW67_05545 [Candidatus Woesearchaeota archaeon]|nr:hypothetical protein [Candidatus Woesearchaeota archaeon]
MKINEAYEILRSLITVKKSILGFRTANDLEEQAESSIPDSWLYAAGAYALEGNKIKFTEMMAKADKAYSAEIKEDDSDTEYNKEAEAVKTLADNADNAYDLIVKNTPKGAGKLNLKEAGRIFFMKSIIENGITVQGGLEAVIAGTKNAEILEDTAHMARLHAGPLIFQVYDLDTEQGKKEFENFKLMKKMSGKPNFPTFLAEGTLTQPKNNYGWYLTMI